MVATDAAFALPTSVALRSAVARTPGPVRFTVLHDALSVDLRGRVEASLPDGDWVVRWVDMSGTHVGRRSPHLSPAANYRLSADDAFGRDAQRIVYLDGDVLVRKNLAPLFDVDLEGRTIGAVRSVNFPNVGSWGAVDHWPELGLDPRAPFFNSGVLVVDVSRWRERRIGPRSLEYLDSPLAGGANADQEALNVALHHDWTALDPTWNQQTPMLDHRRGAHLVFTDEQLEEALSDPAIVHFLDRPKPWHRDCTHPFREEWRAIAEATAFAPISLERTPWRRAMSWRIRRAASALLRGR